MPPPADLPADFLARCKAVTAKRAKTVIDHILQHGQITTEELKETYGYNHPPRAARDVVEQGIPLKTIKVRGSDNRSIGAYVFDTSKPVGDRIGGRTAISKDFKKNLIAANGSKCAVCNASLEERYLQVDHRIPYEIAGDQAEGGTRDSAEYMLLCGSCNRAKSWSCEHCPNWTKKDPEVCKTCYWAEPEDYEHISTRKIRRLDVVFDEKEVSAHDKLKKQAETLGLEMTEFIKKMLLDAASKK